MLQIKQNLYSLVCIHLFQRFNGQLMLGQCRRRWPNINPALIQCCILLPDLLCAFCITHKPKALAACWLCTAVFICFTSANRYRCSLTSANSRQSNSLVFYSSITSSISGSVIIYWVEVIIIFSHIFLFFNTIKKEKQNYRFSLIQIVRKAWFLQFFIR